MASDKLEMRAYKLEHDAAWLERLPAGERSDFTASVARAFRATSRDIRDGAAEIARLTRELEEAREVLHEIADRECSYQAGGAETCPSVLRPRYGVGGRARMCGPCLAEAFFATPPAEGDGDAD